jgi:hypothetical protein
MAGKNGGARPGAGRKRKAEKFAAPIAKAEKRIADRLPQIIDNLLVLAEGVKFVELDRDGKPLELVEGDVATYVTAPDRQANEYLANRIMGKPIDKREITGPEGGSIPVSVVSAIEKVYGIPTDTGGDRSLPDHSS